MAGRLVREAPHLDGTEPIGVWCDAVWSIYADILKDLDREHLDVIEDAWEDITADYDTSQPTAETWGTSEKAQAAQAALLARVGGMPGMGGQ